MNASKLFPEISNLIRLDDIEVKSLEIDSRKVKKGSVFFACKGNSLDGNDYIENAIENGASVVLSDSSLVKEKENIFYVEDLKKKIGIYSSRFYGHPSSKLKTICVTGTNGKTTTAETFAFALGFWYFGLLGTRLQTGQIRGPAENPFPALQLWSGEEPILAQF